MLTDPYQIAAYKKHFLLYGPKLINTEVGKGQTGRGTELEQNEETTDKADLS